MTIVSRGAIEKLGLAQYGLTPVGTGATRSLSTSSVALWCSKFENYFDPNRPKLDKVIITPVDGTEPLAAAIEAGDVDHIGGNPVPGELVDRFRSNADLSVDIKPAPGLPVNLDGSVA